MMQICAPPPPPCVGDCKLQNKEALYLLKNNNWICDTEDAASDLS